MPEHSARRSTSDSESPVCLAMARAICTTSAGILRMLRGSLLISLPQDTGRCTQRTLLLGRCQHLPGGSLGQHIAANSIEHGRELGINEQVLAFGARGRDHLAELLLQ